MPEPVPQLFDVHTLIEQSQPLPRNTWVRYVGITFLVLVLGTALTGPKSPQVQDTLHFLGSLATLLLIGGMGFMTWQAVQRQRQEQQQIEATEELIQLRRWPQAASVLGSMLSVPARSEAGRVQALIFLASVLARYHRFSDAIVVQEHLLETADLDPNTTYAVRLGRAMSLLHEDRLVDADRALTELRRMTSGQKSAGLLLIEIYRDVKTGHPDEALELFNEHATLLRDQLGHRVADAWVLAARAYDLMENTDAARKAYANATVLTPAVELERRYPEIGVLAAKYPPRPDAASNGATE